MRVLHTVAGLWRDTGGPVASIAGLCRTMAKHGHDVCLLTGAGAIHPEVQALETVGVRLRVEPLGPYRAARWSGAYRRACLEEARRTDVVHDHGVWLHTNWSSAAAAKGADRPLIRSPRGMLSPWARSQSPLVKRAVWSLHESSLFSAAAAVHATSELEEREIRALGVTGRIAVIPNGIDTAGEFSEGSIRFARDTAPSGTRTVLFLSRLHLKKGIDILQDAWEQLPAHLPTGLVIAGGGDRDLVERVSRWTRRQLGPPARYVGAVQGQERMRLLASSWVLVLPSLSENYGMAVAEALACGTPAITTPNTPWAGLNSRGCGWTVPAEPPDVAAALLAAITMSQDAREQMASIARAFIEQDHSLEAVALRMTQLYEMVSR